MKTGNTIADIWSFRSIERRLFFACFLTIAFGYAGFFLNDLKQAGSVAQQGIFPLLIFGLSLLLMHVWFIITRFQGDPVILGSVTFLGGFGVLAQYRMGLFDFEDPWRLSHFAYPIGVLMMLLMIGIFKNGRYQALRRLSWAAAGVSLILVAVLIAMGTRYRGAYYAAGQLTPTEILKLLMVLFLGGYFASREKEIRQATQRGKASMIRVLWPVISIYVILMALLLIQRDLGMLAILTMTLCMVLFFLTGQWRYLIASGLGIAATGFIANQFVAHARQRIQTWMDPFGDPTGSGWQILQGLSGMFAGGFLGAGFGKGNPERIPIAESDFMYAVIGEELGFVGCLLVIVFYLIFFHQGYRIAFKTKDYFGSLLAAGIVSVLACQTLLNIGGVTKSLPMTGIPLPLISHGGSNLVTVFLGLGILLSISENQGMKAAKKETRPKPSKRGPATKKNALKKTSSKRQKT